MGSEPAQRAEGRRRLDWLLVAILLLALGLRAVDLRQPLVDAFSWRESSTAMMADNFPSNGWNIFLPEVSWTGPGPSYQGRELQLTSFLCAILNSIFGWHDWFGRLVSALFGTLTVYSLFRIVASIWSKTEAYCAAVILAILPGAVVIDRSYLPDPGMLALVTTGVWVFLRYLEGGRVGQLVLATTLATLGVLAKLPGIAVAIPLAYLALPQFRSPSARRGGWMMVTIAAVAALLAVAAYYAWAMYLAISTPPHHMAGSGYIWSDGVVAFAQRGFYLVELWGELKNWFLTPPFLVLMAIGLAAGRLEAAAPRQDNLLFLWWLVGTALLVLVGAREIVNNPWNLHIMSVPVAAFAGRGLAVAAGWAGATGLHARKVASTSLIAAVLLALGTYPGFSAIHRPYAAAGQQLGEALSAMTTPADLVIAVSETAGDPVAIYYSRRRGWVFPPGGGDADWSRFGDDTTSVALLMSLMDQGAGWFGITSRARDASNEGFFNHYRQLVAWLEKNATAITRSENYLIYKLPASRQPAAK